jgi:hypothetical protein
MKALCHKKNDFLPRWQRKKELKRHATDTMQGSNGPAMNPAIRKQSESCSCESYLARVASNPVTRGGLLIACHVRVANPLLLSPGRTAGALEGRP